MFPLVCSRVGEHKAATKSDTSKLTFFCFYYTKQFERELVSCAPDIFHWITHQIHSTRYSIVLYFCCSSNIASIHGCQESSFFLNKVPVCLTKRLNYSNSKLLKWDEQTENFLSCYITHADKGVISGTCFFFSFSAKKLKLSYSLHPINFCITVLRLPFM